MVQAEATARYIRTSAQKAGLVLELIRGKDVNTALSTLAFARKMVAMDIEKVLRSAIANAQTKDGFGGDDGGFSPLARAVEDDTCGAAIEDARLVGVGFEVQELLREVDGIQEWRVGWDLGWWHRVEGGHGTTSWTTAQVEGSPERSSGSLPRM